ncbi:Protein NEDD1 [Hondaea fermentalgiana]|uniref:Protein NEDD1 n=1 Tax=Hondaea fermentalgiana TaxID=2315210 RepID=A0A2R5GK84_9STRA|nr:Protein NEDD1 [Hondaea fermentalgiana]|eukprot:GBG28691.1 Protein NEDD1 [Hondaea fermentalgiana]
MGELLLASCAEEVAVHVLSGDLSTVARETTDILAGDAGGRRIAAGARPTAVDIDPRGIVVCIGREDGSATLWRVDTKASLGDLPAPVDQRGAIYGVAFASSPRNLATAAEDGVLRIWDLKLMTVAQSFNAFATPATCLSFSADFTRLAAGSTSGDLTVFNLQTNKRTALLKAPTEENNGAQRQAAPLRAIHFNPFRRDIIATCSDAGSVYVWDAMTLTQQASFPRAHRAAASDVAFSPVNRTLLISVGLDGVLLMLDAARSSCVRKWKLDRALTSVSFTHSGTRVAVGTSTGQILLGSLRELRVVNEIDAHVPTPTAIKTSFAHAHAGAPPAEWMAKMEALVDDVRQDVREDVQNVQLEMMRQFRLQMTDIKQTLDTYTSKFADLIEENNRLRAENTRLRNLF